jgi:adenylate kinase family enzyme
MPADERFQPRRIAIVGSASGSGKTTLARTLARHLDATLVEIDAHLHGPNWTQASPDELRARLAPLVAGDAWVIDGLVEHRVGNLVSEPAQLIVWLDLPPTVWLPRLLARSARRWLRREALWNGNRETLRGVFFERDGLVPYAFRSYFGKREQLAARLAKLTVHEGKRVVRLSSVREVAAFVAAFTGRP